MKNELFKFGVNNTKLKNTITFSKSSGLTCPGANKCRAYVDMNAQGKRSVKGLKILNLLVIVQVWKLYILVYITLLGITLAY